jgi:uncharacterized protein YceH (UPF0502 family)
MSDLATLKSRLSEAESAYHGLMTGSLEESVASGDRNVRYKPTEAPKLQAYIADLKSQIAALSGTTSARRRAIAVTL